MLQEFRKSTLNCSTTRWMIATLLVVYINSEENDTATVNERNDLMNEITKLRVLLDSISKQAN